MVFIKIIAKIAEFIADNLDVQNMSVFVPFLAVFIYFVIYAYMLSSVNNFILAKKIAILLPLGGNPYMLILVTGLIGGIAAGVAAMFGKQLAGLVKK